MYIFRVFEYSSPDYQLSVKLRYMILRVPLGLEFTAEELAKDDSDFHMGLFRGDEIVACLVFTRTDKETFKMRQVAVLENLQGKHVGSLLVEKAEKFALANGVKKIYCHARQTAVPFYERRGYKIYSEEFTEVGIPHFAMAKILT